MTHAQWKAHPLVVIAATTLILTCLLAIGVMTGIVPSPLNKTRTADEAVDSGNKTTVPTTRENRLVAERAPGAVERRSAARERTPPAGSTSTSTSQSVAGTGPAAPACANCGTVTSVRTIQRQGEAGMLGPAAGGLLGGVVGSQIGSGSGKTIATIAGAAGGAAIGTEVERRSKSTIHYVVAVRLNGGETHTFNYRSTPGLHTGDRVRVVDGSLIRE